MGLEYKPQDLNFVLMVWCVLLEIIAKWYLRKAVINQEFLGSEQRKNWFYAKAVFLNYKNLKFIFCHFRICKRQLQYDINWVIYKKLFANVMNTKILYSKYSFNSICIYKNFINCQRKAVFYIVWIGFANSPINFI